MSVRIGVMFPMSGCFMWMKTVWSEFPRIGHPYLMVKARVSSKKSLETAQRELRLPGFAPIFSGHRQGWQHHQDDSSRERRPRRSRGDQTQQQIPKFRGSNVAFPFQFLGLARKNDALLAVWNNLMDHFAHYTSNLLEGIHWCRYEHASISRGPSEWGNEHP